MSNIAQFKERGNINYIAVINNVPFEDRLPALVTKYPKENIAAVLTVALTACFEKMNLRYAMTPQQVVELAGMIIESSHEDQLAIEDVILFLQQLLFGQAGKIYDRMDIPTFFELFEKYRQERFEDVMSRHEERDVQFKALPINDRICDAAKNEEKDKQREAVKDYLKTLHHEP